VGNLLESGHSEVQGGGETQLVSMGGGFSWLRIVILTVLNLWILLPLDYYIVNANKHCDISRRTRIVCSNMKEEQYSVHNA
jgi:hypothetical protein